MQGEKSLVTAERQQRLQAQMHAVFVALISKLITAEQPNTFWPEIYLRSLNGLELTKFA